MTESITVAAAQTGPVLTDELEPGVDVACRMIEEAASRSVQIIGFCELFLTPFFPNRLTTDFAKWFIELSDPRIQPILNAAKTHAMALVFPFGEKRGKQFYNSTAVFNGAGDLVGIYRKTHIPAIFPSELKGGTGSFEKHYFTPGSELPVFDVDGLKVGVQICYDRKFPEGTRELAVQGAEVVFMPICAASYGESSLRDDAWDVPLKARAYENGTYVVAINRAGDEHGRRHLGRSMIVSPIGARIMSEACENEAELLVETLDLEQVQVAQTSLPWWRDRRPDLYSHLIG